MVRTALYRDVFSAIADPRRRQVILLLSGSEGCPVNELVDRMKMAQPAVSKHLGALRRANLVTVTRCGQQRVYRLKPETLKPVLEWVQMFERYWTHQTSEIKRRAEAKAIEHRAAPEQIIPFNRKTSRDGKPGKEN
jgi:DNA-binding transcriptional ArsR family regulator